MQQHGTFLVPAVVDAFEEVVEKPLLHRHGGVQVEPLFVPARVALEPFLRRGRLREGLEVAAWMQAESGPAGGAQERHDHFIPLDGAGSVPFVVQGSIEDVLNRIAAILLQLLFSEHVRFGPADQFLQPRIRRRLGIAVLHGHNLSRVPGVEKPIRLDAAVSRHVAVHVGRAFPGDHGGEVRRLQRRDEPLRDGVVGDAVQTDFAVAPGLRARPLDRFVVVLDLARREDVEIPWRPARASRVYAHAHVAPGNPDLGVDGFPGHVCEGFNQSVSDSFQHYILHAANRGAQSTRSDERMQGGGR